MTPQELSNSKLQLLRQGIVAGRILNYISVGSLNCSAWGLWPLRSVELLGGIAQSEYKTRSKSFESHDLSLLAMRLSRSCHRAIPNSNIATGAGDRESLIELAKIGAWRSLVREYEGE